MKNTTTAIIVLTVMMLSLVCGIVAEEVAAGSGDENYHDNSHEYSSGPGETPDDHQDRSESRTRNKDR